MIRKLWILWYIRKFKDAYLVLLFGKLIKNLFDKNEVENLTNSVKFRLFKVFLKLRGYKLCIWKYMYTYKLYVVLTLCHMWFPGDHPIGFHSLCDNEIRSKPVPFHFGWHVLPYCLWGEDVSWLFVGEAAAHGVKRPHAKEVLFNALSLLPMGIEKNLEGMGEAAAHGAKRLHTREDNIMPVVNGWIPWLVYVVVWYICDKLPYVWVYGFGIILLVLLNYSI